MVRRVSTKWFLVAAVAIALLAAGPLQAASESGEFAVKDAGLQTCERFTEERTAQSQPYFQFIGWMSGYLSAYNQFTPQTVDVAPWQTTQLLDAFVADFCSRNPDLTFVRAVNEMIAALAPTRLRGPSEPVEAVNGETTVIIYKTILQRAQQALRELGFHEGVPDGVFGPGTQAAFEALQADAGLPVTGLPDQATLLRLFQ